VFDLPNGRKLALMIHARRMEAVDRLKEAGASMTPDELHDAILRAGGSKAEAERICTDRIKARLKSGEDVG
jgi:hypothetical protein